MKTPVQQLIDYMEANFHLTDESREEFAKALKAEKQQIIDAHQDGFISDSMSSEDYYNETYKK
jgi:hypothetical protein